ncbi:MAG: anti-sigma factor [Saprospiraceae bacterium]
MIDPQAYIESGKLEEYVLGLGSADLMQEVECMSRVFPDIKNELLALQLSLEKYALQTAVIPNPELKTKIFNSLVDASTTNETQDKSAEKSNPIISAHTTSSSSDSLFKWLLALLALSILILFYLYFNKSSQFQKSMAESVLKETAALQTADSLSQVVTSLQSEISIINNPNGVAIKMAGTKLYPDGLATIYWDKNTQTVHINPGNLPVAPTGKQYQLWGIVDGKPVSLGLIDLTAANLQSMSPVDNPSTFAVTLEPTGGNASPTLDQMYVAGNVVLIQ